MSIPYEHKKKQISHNYYYQITAHEIYDDNIYIHHLYKVVLTTKIIHQLILNLHTQSFIPL